MGKDRLSPKNLIILISLFVGLIVVVVSYQYYEKTSLHHSLKSDQIDRIVYEGFSTRILNEKEMNQFVKLFNSSTDIRNNKELAGIGTPDEYIKIYLKSGECISICNGGKYGLEVQTEREGKIVCYWMEQPKIKKDLLEINK